MQRGTTQALKDMLAIRSATGFPSSCIAALVIVPNAAIAFGAVAFPTLTTIQTILGSVPKTADAVARPRPYPMYTSLQEDILSTPLRDLPGISLADTLFTPTAQLLTRGEACAPTDARAQLRVPEVDAKGVASDIESNGSPLRARYIKRVLCPLSEGGVFALRLPRWTRMSRASPAWAILV
jgi:hypothetical protein